LTILTVRLTRRPYSAWDTIDYGIVVRGEMTLELDDGQKVHLRQGDCVVQNETRHRWRNPLPEPCLMAFISIGGERALARKMCISPFRHRDSP